MDATYVINHIREEVDGARGYLALYKELGDIEVLSMSVDELHHATYFVKNGGIAVPPDLINMYDSVKKSISDEIKRQGEINYGNGEQVQDKVVQANRN